jgi:hypothetical protein
MLSCSKDKDRWIGAYSNGLTILGKLGIKNNKNKAASEVYLNFIYGRKKQQNISKTLLDNIETKAASRSVQKLY